MSVLSIRDTDRSRNSESNRLSSGMSLMLLIQQTLDVIISKAYDASLNTKILLIK